MGVGHYQRHVRANFRRDHPVSDLHRALSLHIACCCQLRCAAAGEVPAAHQRRAQRVRLAAARAAQVAPQYTVPLIFDSARTAPQWS